MFPKSNSLLGDSEAKPLADMREFADKIRCMKDHQKDPDFQVLCTAGPGCACWPVWADAATLFLRVLSCLFVFVQRGVGGREENSLGNDAQLFHSIMETNRGPNQTTYLFRR